MSSQAPTFDFEKARFNMIEQQIRPWEVLDAHVLDLLGKLKREQFVPAEFQALALADIEIPLTTPAAEGQSMLPPKLEARILQDLALNANENVLEIGTGSGYTAAMMASQCAQVHTLEIDSTLARTARENLARAGITNVTVHEADATANGFAACAVAAPYDAIVLSGSVSDIPEALLALLKTGGRLFAIVGQEPVMRATIVRKTGPSSFHTEQPWDMSAPRLQHFPEPSRFRF